MNSDQHKKTIIILFVLNIEQLKQAVKWKIKNHQLKINGESINGESINGESINGEVDACKDTRRKTMSERDKTPWQY